MLHTIAGAWRRLVRACTLIVALAALMAPGAAAQAPPEQPWGTTTVRYLDLDPEPGVVDPQFSWDPIARAARYEVEVNPSSDWAVGSRVCCNERAIGTSLSPLKLLPNNTYYWRMRAFDAAGTAGPWNVWCGGAMPSCPAGVPPLGFTKTFDAVVPTIPDLRVRDSAGDHTPPVGGSGFPTTDAPVIAWDPVPGASSYELRVAPWDPTSGGFCNWTSLAGRTYVTATTAWTPLAPTNAASPVGNAHPAVTSGTALTSGTSYCVRARARSDRDAMGAEIVSDWTQIGGLGHAAFTYQAPALPPCGATSMPASSYHDEPSSGTAASRMPLFTWDRVSGACGYFVVVAKDPDFTKVIDVAFTTAPAYAPRASTQPMTYMDETTSYYWAVMPSASDKGDGVSTQPQENHPRTFNKRSVPPTPLSPKAGVTGQPSFRWTAAEGARNYRIQADSDPNFGSPITDVVTNSTAHTSLNKYPVDTPLYWRVRANDETGVGLAWSDVATFSALAPETYLYPGPVMNGSSASFHFASDLPDASFKCRLNGPGTKIGTSVACHSPLTYPSLADGVYTFTVAAADLAGNADATPATRQFTVDTIAPETSITSRPAAAINSTTASLAFTATEAGSAFECKLDGPAGTTAAWGACSSPRQFSGLQDGGYTFSVRASDPAGNADATPATTSFAVDTEAPDTVILTGPPATATATTAAFTFAATSADARFECRLDRPGGTSSWTSCGSSMNYNFLTGGSYAFSVRAIDKAGNVDATPAGWTFALTAPAVPPTPPPVSPIDPVSPTTPDGSPLPVAHELGVPTFAAPSRPLRVRRATVRLRFRCADPDGCVAATFVFSRSPTSSRPAFTLTIKVRAGAGGDEVIAVKLPRAALRALEAGARRGIRATITRAGTGERARVRLVAGR